MFFAKYSKIIKKPIIDSKLTSPVDIAKSSVESVILKRLTAVNQNKSKRNPGGI